MFSLFGDNSLKNLGKNSPSASGIKLLETLFPSLIYRQLPENSSVTNLYHSLLAIIRI